MKPRFVPVTGDEAAALQANGKYRPDKPHWVLREGQMWVLVDEIWRTWHENYCGNMRCQK